MVNIKICGVQRSEDIKYINTYKPEFIGFVFADSRRRISPRHARNLVQLLDKNILRAGVFVNESISSIVEITARCQLDVVQLHGDELPEYVINLKKEMADNIKTPRLGKIQVWKAVRVKDKSSILEMENFHVDTFVLDAYHEKEYGGMGKSFDWNVAVEAKKFGRIVIAGGLNKSNVSEVLKKVHPYGVDVSSGVETNGHKDEFKIRDFLYTVREEKIRNLIGGYSNG